MTIVEYVEVHSMMIIIDDDVVIELHWFYLSRDVIHKIEEKFKYMFVPKGLLKHIQMFVNNKQSVCYCLLFASC